MDKGMLKFREAVRPSDEENVRGIVRSTGFFSEDEIDIAVELVTERLDKGKHSGYYFIFVEMEGKTVAYTCFGPIPATKFSYDLYWIAVHKAHRGTGIGRRLLEETEKAIKKMGGQHVYIETSGRDQYTPTRSFYLACGYREEAVLKDFYSPGDPKYFYVKSLR